MVKKALGGSPKCFLTCQGEEPKFSLSILVRILMDASVVSLRCDKARKSRTRTHCVGLQTVLVAGHPQRVVLGIAGVQNRGPCFPELQDGS